MAENMDEKREADPVKMFGLILPSLPYLILKFGGTYLRFKKSAQRAGKTFKKELINQGLDKEIANELTEVYMQGSNLSNFVKRMS